jgi:hypothetical protein
MGQLAPALGRSYTRSAVVSKEKANASVMMNGDLEAVAEFFQGQYAWHGTELW